MRVSFVIPLYNCLPLTQATLASLQATLPPHLAHEIILVDDGSTDGTREWLASLPPPCRVLLNDRNRGFAGTCNRGAGLANGTYLVFLNNDLELLPGWLEPMLAALETRADLGAIGNVQRRIDDGTIDHAGIEVTPAGKLAHIESLPDASSARGIVEVPGLTAACLMVRRAEFVSAGSFDEAFVNGGEDIDLCFRLRRRGLSCAVAVTSVIRHHVSAARGPTGRRDEMNSRLLVQRWHDELVRWGAFTWTRDQLRTFRREPSLRAVPRLVRLLPFGLGWTSHPPAEARRLLRSALHRENARWHYLFDPVPGAMRAPRQVGGYWEERCFRDGTSEGTVWIRDRATIHLPAGFPGQSLILSGMVLPPPAGHPEAADPLGFCLVINGSQRVEFRNLPVGHFNLGTDAPQTLPGVPTRVEIEVIDVAWRNFLAWAGRVTQGVPLPANWRERLERLRYQALQRRLRFEQVVADDEVIFDFHRSPALHPRLRNPIKATGLNLVGWFRAAVGIGESVRCMARACDAAGLPAALIDLRLHCLNAPIENAFDDRLQAGPAHTINVFHVDPPVSDQIDHHHGPELRRDRYNIAYWAWELPIFPSHWVPQMAYFDEIWCPSDFVRRAIAARTKLPVLVMPHAIDFPLPPRDGRRHFGLEEGRFLFLFAYDLNSYQERKNPLAVVAAYRRAFPDETGVGLVIKTQNRARNPQTHAQLLAAVAGLRHARVIEETLSRPDILRLQQACDAFVSLHRAEGFGLAVAEAMYLGKPVIATDWSATAEFLDATNGLPVPWTEIELRESHGPYEAGQKWADPDLDAAAQAMRRLVAEPALAGRLGAAAAAAIRSRFSPAAVGARYRARLDALFPDNDAP